MKTWLLTGILGAFLLGGCSAAKPIRTLIVTGEDVDVHKWNETTPALKKLLDDSGKFETVVSEKTDILDSDGYLQGFDLLVFNYYNAKQPTISDKAKANVADFVKGGKGLVVFHLSSAAFKEWDEYHTMAGRYWKMGASGHGPRSPFKVKIADPKDPIAQGLADFDADDELYAKLQGEEPKIHVLVTADSDFSKKTEPLAFTVDYGKGRVYHHAFGHDVKAIQEPQAVATLFVRGAEWAATGKVTPEKACPGSGACPVKAAAAEPAAPAVPAAPPTPAPAEKK
jgi:uncharacterized protein